MPAREDAAEGRLEVRAGVEDGGDRRDRVLRRPREIVEFALLLDDARSVEVEHVSVQHEREVVVADPLEHAVDHLRDETLRREAPLPVAHPEPVGRLRLAQVNIGKGHGVAHGN